MIQDQKHWCQILLTRISNRSSVPKYQLLLFINFSLKWMLAGMILFSLNFFYITPEFKCSESELPSDKTCQQFVCTLSQDRWVSHMQSPLPKSISLDYGIILVCGNKWISSILQSISYLGSFLGYIIMSHMADNYGRKITQNISWYLNIVGLILLITSQNLVMVGIGSFFMGLGTNAAITLHYTFMKEFFIGKMRQRCFIILQVMFSIGVGLVAGLSWAIYDWKVVAGVFMLVPSILIVPFSIWIMQQTPNFNLLKSKQTLLTSLNKIASINSQQPLCIEDLQFISEPLGSQNSREYSLLDLFRYKSLQYITISCAVIDLAVQFIYDGTILSLDKIGINVYLDQILVGFVQIFAAIFCSYIVVKVRRNIFIKICFVLVSFFTVVIGIITLVFEHKDNQINFHVILEMLLLAMLRFVINSMWGLFFVYVGQLFPTCVLSLAFGWVSAIGTVGAVSAPFIRLLTANATMFIMSGLCVLCFFVVGQLRETKGEKCIQEIQERNLDSQGKRSIQSESQKQNA